MLNDIPFIGRERELQRLRELRDKKTASLVAIKGRRRVGKSRLVAEFAKDTLFLQFYGLAPVDGITAQDQRNEFAIQLSRQTDLPEVRADDWSKLFLLLAEKIKKGRVVVLFDEITWMSHGDPTFLSKLKNAWDMHFQKNPKLIFILCGSISPWIEKHILSSTGYFGRISLKITLRELPLKDANHLLDALGFKRSTTERLIVLSLTGGIPWYIEQINPKLSALENIKKLCFSENGLLVEEFKHIFHDLFGRRSNVYQQITQLLAAGSLSYEALSQKLKYQKGSALTDYMQELVSSGYISQHHAWKLKSGKLSRLSLYRLSDNYLRFYFKYIEPRLPAITRGKLEDISFNNLPGWSTMLGLQFENLILNNRKQIFEKLAINPIDVIADDPYFQTATKRQKGCQIDYLIQTQFNTLFICEIKFSQKSLTTAVIREMKEKISRLSVPRGFALLPVLIHLSDVSDEVYDADYFYRIIDMRNFIES